MEKNEEDKVWVTISRTINLGNYENIKIDAGMSQTLLEKEDRKAVLEDVCDATFEIILLKSREYKHQLTKKKTTRHRECDATESDIY